MKTSNYARKLYAETPLLVLDGSQTIQDFQFKNFIDILKPGDVLVYNRSATLPASFDTRHPHTGESFEIRLASYLGPGDQVFTYWMAIALGLGSWRQDTNDRPPPPKINVGDQLVLGPDLQAEVIEVKNRRLLSLRLKSKSKNIVGEIFNTGAPIQYSYHREPLQMWDQQSFFSTIPISVEPPSASFPFNQESIRALKNKGVQFADVLHGAGISSTGDLKLDLMLPLPEWSEVPWHTANTINRARSQNSQVIAIGTTVVRALESALDHGKIIGGKGVTTIKIKAPHKITSVTGMITGIHDLNSSHWQMTECLCTHEHLRAAYQHAKRKGYHDHEYGDLSLLRCAQSEHPAA